MDNNSKLMDVRFLNRLTADQFNFSPQRWKRIAGLEQTKGHRCRSALSAAETIECIGGTEIATVHTDRHVLPSGVSGTKTTASISGTTRHRPGTDGSDPVTIALKHGTSGLNPVTIALKHGTSGRNPVTIALKHGTSGRNPVTIALKHGTSGRNPVTIALKSVTGGLNPVTSPSKSLSDGFFLVTIALKQGTNGLNPVTSPSEFLSCGHDVKAKN